MGLLQSWAVASGQPRGATPTRGLPYPVSPPARCSFVFFFPPPLLSNSFKISYIHETGSLGPRLRELWLLRSFSRGFFRHLVHYGLVI